MKQIAQTLLNFAADESGATAIEYGLIAGLVGLTIVGGATLVGGEVDRNFRCLRNGIRGVSRFNDGLGPCD